MSALLFVVSSFAVYRVSRMIANRTEEGPFGVFSAMRERLGVNKQDTWWRRGLTCPMCVSFWVGQVFGFLLLGVGIEAVLYGLAFSGVAVLLTAISG